MTDNEDKRELSADAEESMIEINSCLASNDARLSKDSKSEEDVAFDAEYLSFQDPTRSNEVSTGHNPDEVVARTSH